MSIKSRVRERLLEEFNAVKDKINKAIKRFFPRKEPFQLYDAALHLIKAGGKRIRPFLAIKSCELVSGKKAEDEVLPFAVGLELLHNFTLIHDDIMDRSRTRRGVITVHRKWGRSMAINAGDLLFAKAYNAILSNSPLIASEKILRALSVFSRAHINICDGQAQDIILAKKKEFTEEEYFEMIKLKTAALFQASSEIGAILGGGSEEQINRLSLYGLNLGMAFQIKDDILGIFGDEKLVKKPIGSDIREGKKTILIAYTLRHAPPNKRKKLLSVLGKRGASPEEVKEAIEIIREVNADKYAYEKAYEYVQKAKEQLNVFPSSETKEILWDLVDFTIQREF